MDFEAEAKAIIDKILYGAGLDFDEFTADALRRAYGWGGCMTNPLQQAIERSRAASDWCTTEERVFREAAAIMAEALPDLIHWAKRGLEDIESVTASALLETAITRAEIAIAKGNALFEEGEGC